MDKKAVPAVYVAGLILISFMGCRRSSETPKTLSYFLPKNPPAARYVLEAQCRVEEGTVRLDGAGRIAFINSSNKPISRVALKWSNGPKSVLEVSAHGQKLPPLDTTPAEQGIVFFRLPRPFGPNDEVRLDVRFGLETSTRSNGDVSLQRWYPKLWWDGLSTRDSFKVKFEAPEGFKAATSGRLNPRTGFLENPGVTTNFGLWLFRSIEVEERDADGVLIRAFHSREGTECALLCLETAVDVVRFYQRFHGFFPFNSLTIIPGASRPMGGYPFASALVVIHGQEAFDQRPELHWKWITAHEIGHQYWGECVMSEEEPSDYTESWLMIGMGILADRMYVEARDLGDDKHQAFFDRFMGGLQGGYDITADAPESLKSRQKYDRNNILIHGKGYSIISALRSVLGDETFKKVYLRCVSEYGGKRMSAGDFRRIAEEESGGNLRWFFDQWVRSSRYLCYQITAAECHPEGRGFLTEISVEAKGESLLMPVEVQAVFKDGSSLTARTDRFSRRSKIIFRSETELEKTLLDPRRRLAMLEAPLPIIPDELPDKVRALPYNGSWDQGLDMYKIALDSGVQDFQIWFKLGMVVFEGGYFDEAFTCFDKMLAANAPQDYHFMAWTWKGNIRDAQGRREEAIEFYKKALPMASEGAWRHDQFGIQSSREWIEQRLDSPYDWARIVKISK